MGFSIEPQEAREQTRSSDPAPCTQVLTADILPHPHCLASNLNPPPAPSCDVRMAGAAGSSTPQITLCRGREATISPLPAVRTRLADFISCCLE